LPRSWAQLLGEENAQPEPEADRAGLFSRLRDSLSKSRRALTAELASAAFDPGDDAAWERLEEALIRADVGVPATAELVEALEEDGLDAALTCLHEWRGALFRVRLARLRLTVPAPPAPQVDQNPSVGVRAPLLALLLAVIGATAAWSKKAQRCVIGISARYRLQSILRFYWKNLLLPIRSALFTIEANPGEQLCTYSSRPARNSI